MRSVLQALLAVLFVGAGVGFGASNARAVSVDCQLFPMPAALGVTALCAALVAVLPGGLAVTVSVVRPLRRRLRAPAPAR
ncbi:MAG: hypothetical protein JSS44_00615 [Proteobacteria bacterium]|nr:hypothetical protein [Pseudomonadota bacterium]